VDGVKTINIGARIASSWASSGEGKLLWGVGDEISGAGARIALESVKETEPMTNLVRHGLTKVVIGKGAAWSGFVKDGAAIKVEAV
jgi:hypothetical protein